jgi:hypothetical protein
VSLARYLVRMSGRPTPFGLFAGVAALDFGNEPSAVWEPEEQWVRTRAHTVWLARIIGGLETHAELRSRLPVIANDLAYERGDRLMVPWQPHGTDPTRSPAAQVSLRLTPAVRVARGAAATSALVRLSPHPDGVPGWREYHEAFVSRFGAHALVPVTMLVDPVSGLGYPSHLTELDTDLPPALTARDTRLLRLAQQAALDGAQEVVLDEAFIDSLHDEDPAGLRVPPHLEMCGQLWAPSMDAIAGGQFRLVLSALSRTAASLAGRLIDLLAEPDQQRRHKAYNGLPSDVDGAITAQLSFPPIHAHLENVARAPQLLPVLVTVAEHHPSDGDRITLDDLAVTADNRGMYLVSLSRQRVVEPMLANAVARRVMPPMVRLLFEIPRAVRAASFPFAWGAARCLPFLPRVVHGRTVLAMARWSLTSDTLPAAGLPNRQWRLEFEALRHRVGLPDTISVGESDLRLRLALDEPMDLAVLRDYLDKARTAASTVMVSEAGTAADHGWFDGRAHEIIIPFASTRPTTPLPRSSRDPARSRLSARTEASSRAPAGFCSRNCTAIRTSSI